MRILYLCHRIPYPPNKGEKIRAFHQLKALAAKHEVDLFTLVDDPDDLPYQAALTPYCRTVTAIQIDRRIARWKTLPYLATGTPLTLPYFYSKELAHHVRTALAERTYDRVFVYCSAMVQYMEGLDESIPLLADIVDVDSDKWRQYAPHVRFPLSVVYRREAHCLRACERRICEQAAAVLVTTGREASLVREMCDANVHVLPVGVDTGYFDPAQISPETRSPTIVFTGDMGYFPNVDAVGFFARQVFPLIRRQIPEARFTIVGRNPAAGVQALADIPGIEVTGAVPDVRPYLARASVAVAPFSIAAGIQNKILEAMAFGLPVVATTRAVQALSPRVAAMAETSDSPEGLAAKVVNLLSYPEFAFRNGQEARARVADDYNWDRASSQLHELIEHPFRTQPARQVSVHIA